MNIQFVCFRIVTITYYIYTGGEGHTFFTEGSRLPAFYSRKPRVILKILNFFSVEKACVESPCMNDGICHETSEGFHCECNQGWKGHACDGKHCILI